MIKINRIRFLIIFFTIAICISCFNISIAYAADGSVSEAKPEPVVALTAQERAWLKAHPNIVLAYTDTFEPEVIVNPDGSHSGILVDFLDEMNRRLGTRITLRIDSIPVILQKAKNKEVDGILEMLPEYADKLGLLKSIGYLRAYPAVFARKNFSFAGPDDFAGKKIAIIDEIYFSEKMVREYGEQATILRVKDAIQGMKSVSEGDADLYIGVSFNSYYITKYQLFDVVTKYIFRDFPDKFGFAVRPDWPELVPILNKGISSFSQNDIDAIVAKWVHLPQQEITVELTLEEQAWLKAHQPIRLGYKAEYPPYLMTGEKNLQSGIFADLRDELSRKLGVDIVIAEFKTFTDLLQASEKKAIDAVYAIMPSRAKKRGLLPTEVFLHSYTAIFTRQGKPVNHLDDVIGKTVAMAKDQDFVLRILKPYLEQVTIVAADTPVDGLRLLSDGKVDMYIGTTTHSFMVNKFRIGGISQAYIHKDEELPFAMGVRPDRPELVTVLNKGLAHIGQRGIETIVARWLKIQEPEERVQLNATERAWLDQNHTVRVRAAEWPPYLINKENEPPQGITVEYLKLIEERTGINFEYEVTKQSFAEFLKSMKEGQGPDMTAIIAPSPERKEYLSFSTPYTIASYVILARDQDEIFLDINDLAGKTVAVTKGHVIQQFLEKNFPEIELLLFDNDELALLALSTGNTEAYIGNLTVATHIIQKRGLSNLRVVASTPYGDQILSMGNRKDWPELTSIMNKALASITEEEKSAIQNKYIALKYEQGLDRVKVIQWILILVLTATGILLLFVFWNWQLRRKVGVRTADLEAEIVERKQVVAALLDSEEKFRGLVKQSPLSIQILNLDGQIIQVNKAWHELWGISDEDLPEVLREYNMLEDEQAREHGIIPLIKKAFKGEIVTLPVIEYDGSTTMGNLELEHVKANKRWLQGRLYPIRNSEGEVLNVVNIEEDITERKRAEEELLQLKDQLHEENIYLREEIQLEHNFEEIIGNSEGLSYVLFRVEQIAATDTTVLILGETGTGKELVARAIHNTSPRKERPLIKVNCATLPAHLIESELFGHEKGAFTGATVQRIGRFELADGATLFLDEIGEMPLELQSKLLRVLQDGEFERLGSSRTIKVDVRLITATNRDLESEIQSGRFRQDLLYRLNVYSLTLPPLRERPEDIPLLVDAFIKTFNKKLGKRVELISKKTKDALIAYSWPGNIRELQNVIEKAVIIAQDKALRVELPEIQTPMPANEPTQTLDEMERDYIQEVLTLKNWRIDGPKGAAVVLDLKPSTLRFRMQKLGIKRPS